MNRSPEITGEPQNKMARSLEKMPKHQHEGTTQLVAPLECHTKFVMHSVGTSELGRRQLRGQSNSKGMFLSCCADDLVFVQPDITLKNIRLRTVEK